MPAAWLAALGLAAAVLGVSTALPQVWRLLRSGHADGLSITSVVLGVLAAGTWLVYGLLQADPPQIVANVPGLLGATAIAVLVVRRTTARPARVLAAAAGWSAAVVAVHAVGGPTAVGTAATAVSLVGRAPQVREVFVAPSLTGISPTSFALSVTACTLWAVYGFGTGQVPVWASSLVAGSMSLVIWVKAVGARTADVPTALPDRPQPAQQAAHHQGAQPLAA